MSDFIMNNVSTIYVLAFCLIWHCSDGLNQRVWLILACHAAANVAFNVFAYPSLDYDPWLVVAFLSAGDAIAVGFLLGIWNPLAKAQTALVSFSWLYQWIYVIEIHVEAYPDASAITLIYEPLILAIGICQVLLGGNAVASGIRKLASSNTPGHIGSRAALRSCDAVSKNQVQTER